MTATPTNFRTQQLAMQAQLFAGRELDQMAITTKQAPADGYYVELGSGSGDFLAEFAERFPDARFFGAEIAPAAVAYSREQVKSRGLEKRVEIQEADVTTDAVDQQIGEADIVMLRYTLLHIPNPSDLLKRLGDVMKSGAIIVGIEPIWGLCRELSGEGLFQEFMDAQLKVLAGLPGGTTDMAIQLPGLFTGSGFESVAMNIAHVTNQTPDPDLFAKTLAGAASFVHQLAPSIIGEKYPNELGPYIASHPERTMTMQTTVVTGVKK